MGKYDDGWGCDGWGVIKYSFYWRCGGRKDNILVFGNNYFFVFKFNL